MKNKLIVFPYLSLVVLFNFQLITADAATLTVSNNSDSAAGSLRAAITNAHAGDTIIFATNMSGQTITLTTGQLLVSSNLTIDASALVSGLIISGNNASRVLLIANNATVVLKSLKIYNGQVTNDFGGAVYNSTNCNLTLSNCVVNLSTVIGNGVADLGSGGLYNAGTLTLAGCTITGNTISFALSFAGIGRNGRGGGLYNVGTATLTECTVQNNFARGDNNTLSGLDGGIGAGGGIYNIGTLTLNRNTFTGNHATGGNGGDADVSTIIGGNGGMALGGGLYSAGSATLNQNTFGANSLQGGKGGNSTNSTPGDGGDGGSSEGGAIYNTGLLTLNQDTISGNFVRQGVAGIGATINGAAGAAQGGGIFNTAIGTNCTPLNCLIARNYAPNLTGNSTNTDVMGIFFSRGHNLVGVTNGSTNFTASGDLKGTAISPLNPLLGALTARGGPTDTFAPQPGSPAIDAGDDSVTNTFATDQRGTGYARRVGAHVGIGSYEVEVGSAPSITSVIAGSVTLNPVTLLGSLTVNANVNPNTAQFPTTAWVQYGPSTNYGLASTTVTVAGVGYAPVNQPLTSLAPGFLWHFIWVATNSIGTNFSADQTFYVPSIAIPGDTDGDGVVSQSELDGVYAHYVTNSPWLAMTNVAGLGGTNVLFSLSNSVLGAYTVQYNTNLATTNWYNLGTATPRYLFTDTNAPANPKRYYRLRYP